MSSPWLSIPLPDYEGHMDSAGVQQLTVLRELFQCALDRCSPTSVAILGIAGGNGLEQLDSRLTTRILGVDINQSYLDEVGRRFVSLPGLELHCRDLREHSLSVSPVALVHAALIFEHAGTGATLDNALGLVASGGYFSVVLQLPGDHEHDVACTSYPSMQTLRNHFELIDVNRFQRSLRQKGFRLIEEKIVPLPAGKKFWLGIFSGDGVALTG